MLARPREEGELFRVVGQLQRRLGREQLLLYVLRGAMVGAGLVVAIGLSAWLVEQPSAVWGWAVAAMAPLCAAGWAIGHWPSAMQAARAADRHLELDERLATAVELARRRHGRFDGVQVQDALASVHAPPGSWPSWTQRHQTELLIATVAGILALSSLLLPNLPRPRFDSPEASPAVDAEVAASDQVRSVPAELEDSGFQTSSSVASPNDDQASEDQLAQRVQQAQAARQALDRLAQALGQVSATQSAGEAIQRGDYQSARDQISSLGDDADQLSNAAKQQLASALQQAAGQTASNDRPLSDRERQASQALARGYYNDERQALRQLADQVQRSAQNSPSQGQLARDVGRLQQSRAAGVQNRTATDDGQASSQQGAQGSPSQSGSQGSTNGQGTSSSSSQQSASGQGQSGVGADGSGDGQQGGPGAGVGSTDPLGDPSGRLDSAGQRVDVPVKLGDGPGERPANGTEDQSAQPYGSTQGLAAEQAQHQDASQVLPENNLVPGDQRPVIRGYFTGEGR